MTRELIIIGGGPAGLTAGLYASRAKLDCLLVEKMMPGGQVLYTASVENYPGFTKPIAGPKLANEMAEQAKGAGLKIEDGEVVRVKAADKGGGFILECASKKGYEALSVIAASGARWKRLGVPGEEELKGKGVSYCATCDGPIFKGKDIVVVGGGDKALEEALFLTKFAKGVKIVHRRDRFRAVEGLQERALANKRVTPVYNSVVTEICGKKSVESVNIRDVKTEKEEKIPCDAVFILIGIEPASAPLKGLVETDEKGFIVTDGAMKSSRNGIYACGDVVKKELYQIATAVGEGAAAAFSAEKYIAGLKGRAYP